MAHSIKKRMKKTTVRKTTVKKKPNKTTTKIVRKY